MGWGGIVKRMKRPPRIAGKAGGTTHVRTNRDKREKLKYLGLCSHEVIMHKNLFRINRYNKTTDTVWRTERCS